MKGVGKLVLGLVAAFALLQALLFLMLPRTRDFVVRPLSRPVVEYLDKYSSEGLLEVVVTKHFWESMVSYWKGQKPPRRPFKPTWQPPSAEAFEQARKQRELEEAERVKREIVPEQAHPDDLRVLQHLVSLGWFESVPACAKQPPVVCDFEGHVIELTLKGRPLGGSIPAELAGLRQLERLNLAGTGLQGTIPQALGSLKRLSKLVLAENGLSGEIPQSFVELESLDLLSLQRNQLTGEIPEFLCFSTPQLVALHLFENQLTGSIPSCIGNLRYLQYLNLQDNNLSGEFPLSSITLYALKKLDISNNHISGQLPRLLGNMKRLQSLRVGNNSLTGWIPRSLSELFEISHFEFTGNSFYCPHPHPPCHNTGYLCGPCIPPPAPDSAECHTMNEKAKIFDDDHH